MRSIPEYVSVAVILAMVLSLKWGRNKVDTYLIHHTKWNDSLLFYLPNYQSSDVPDYLIFVTVQAVTNPTPIYG